MTRAGYGVVLPGAEVLKKRKSEFESVCTGVSINAFTSLLVSFAARYSIGRDVLCDDRPEPTPATLHEELNGLFEWAYNQREFLNGLSDAARDELAIQALIVTGSSGGKLRHQILSDLGRLAGLAEGARRRVEARVAAGAPVNIKGRLARAVADLLADAGLELGTRKGSALRVAYGLALDALDLEDGAENKTLARALKGRKAEDGKNAPTAP